MDKKQTLIEGVFVTPLRQIEDNRGAVYHVLKNDSPQYTKFGEVYISKVNPGIIKAWKYHREMKQNFSVPYGDLKLVVADLRQGSSTFNVINEFVLGPNGNYKLITLPAKVWYGFQCISDSHCLLLNIADIKHDFNESKVLGISNEKIQYLW